MHLCHRIAQYGLFAAHLPKYSGHVPKIGLFNSINIADNINSTLMHFEMYGLCVCTSTLHWQYHTAVVLHQIVT